MGRILVDGGWVFVAVYWIAISIEVSPQEFSSRITCGFSTLPAAPEEKKTRSRDLQWQSDSTDDAKGGAAVVVPLPEERKNSGLNAIPRNSTQQNKNVQRIGWSVGDMRRDAMWKRMNGKSEQIPTRILHVAVPKSNLKSEFQESSIRVAKNNC